MSAVQDLENSLSDQELKSWAEIVQQLRAKGVKPSEVRREILKKKATQKEEEAGSWGWGAMSASLDTRVTWKHVLYVGLGVLAFAGLLKLIGMAFDVNIPLLHTASVQ